MAIWRAARRRRSDANAGGAVGGSDGRDLPEPVRELARQCVLDYLGCAVAGADDRAGRHPARRDGGGRRRRRRRASSAIACDCPLLAAALVNGAVGHALDYDDVNLAMPGHPSVAILPGLLALAELKGSSGREVITAFVAGYETACRIGMALQPGHYALGFHSTATIGAFGAAAACAHLLGLDAEATARGARHRRDPGGRAQIAIRHDVQAVPRRQGRAERTAGGASRRARVFQPPRSSRMRAGLRRDARPGFFAGDGAGDARERLSSVRQPLQVPRRLLHDARADRMRPPGAPRSRAEPRCDRRDHLAARCRMRPDLQHSRPAWTGCRANSACVRPWRWPWPGSTPPASAPTARRTRTIRS